MRYCKNALLFKYGGYWIDPTYLIATPITKVYRTFDTLHLDYCFTNSHPFVNAYGQLILWLLVKLVFLRLLLIMLYFFIGKI